jgi:DNA repair protein RAD57
MTDLHTVLPSFPTEPHAAALAALARANVQTADLAAALDAGNAAALARRARLPPADVARLAAAVSAALLSGVSARVDLPREWRCVSTLDARLDAALGGGFPAGYVTEITGERCEPSQSHARGRGD